MKHKNIQPTKVLKCNRGGVNLGNTGQKGFGSGEVLPRKGWETAKRTLLVYYIHLLSTNKYFKLKHQAEDIAQW
jgi:hypothetical protein